MRHLPKFLHKYFREIDFAKLDFDKSKIYILKRILEYGDKKIVRWMVNNFTKDEIKNALKRLRGFPAKTANFWALIFDIPRDEVLCLRRRLLREQKTLWPY